MNDDELMELVKASTHRHHPVELQQTLEFYKDRINKTPAVPKEGFEWLAYDSNKKYTRFEMLHLLTPLDRLRCEVDGNMIPMDTYHIRGIPADEKTGDYLPDNELQARWLGMKFRGKHNNKVILDPVEWLRPLNVGFQVVKPNSVSRADILNAADFLGYGIRVVKEEGISYVQRLA